MRGNQFRRRHFCRLLGWQSSLWMFGYEYSIWPKYLFNNNTANIRIRRKHLNFLSKASYTIKYKSKEQVGPLQHILVSELSIPAAGKLGEGRKRKGKKKIKRRSYSVYPWVIHSFNSVCFTRIVFRFHYYLRGKDQKTGDLQLFKGH